MNRKSVNVFLATILVAVQCAKLKLTDNNELSNKFVEKHLECDLQRGTIDEPYQLFSHFDPDYSCNAKNMEIVSNNTILYAMAFHNGRRDIVNVTEVDHFYVRDQSVKFLPLKLSQVFHRLRGYTIFESELQSIARNNFEDLKDLQFLKIFKNLLENLPVDAFYDLSKLDTLDLSQNEIGAIHRNTFFQNRMLKYLLLSHNQITHLDGSLFKKNPKLEEIHISNNLLTSIGAELFTPVKNPIRVSLAFNTCINRYFSTLIAEGPAIKEMIANALFQKC